MASERKFNQQEILDRYQALREERDSVVRKLNSTSADLKEHEAVIETLNETEPSRRCYRNISGVLVEKTVGGVLPALGNNKLQLASMKATLEKQLEEKIREVATFTTDHKIKFQSLDDLQEEETAESS